jgi:hypothetical protein
MPFDEAIKRAEEALKSEGFGVISRIDIQDAHRLEFTQRFGWIVHVPQLAQREKIDGEGIQFAVKVDLDRVVYVSQATEPRHPVPQPTVIRVEYVGSIHMVSDAIHLAIVGVAGHMTPAINHENRAACIAHRPGEGTAE